MNSERDIIIIPTYNEKDNIGKIISKVSALYPALEIWVVDDSSPDGTASVVSKIMKSNKNVRLHIRKQKTGLGDAYKDTLQKIQKMSDVRSVITMDADGSHNPSKIGELLDSLKNYDLSIGSRYAKGGGGMKGMGMYRNFLSMGGNLYARLIIGFGINDSTAGFVAFRKTALDGIDIPAIASSGYSYQIEFKNTLVEAGRSVTEIPITFIDREIGLSKMSGKIITEGVLTPWRIAARKTFKKSNFLKVLRRSLIISAVVCAFIFSLFNLKESPPVWYDEGLYIQNATNLVSHGIVGIRLTPQSIIHISQFSVGFPVIYPLAGVVKIFGPDIFAERALMIFFILALVVSSYFLAKKLFGPNLALFSLLLISSFPPLYGNGKSVLGETPGLLFVLLALICLYFARARGQSSSRYLTLAGLFMGLAIVTKPFFLILIPAVIIGFFVGRRQMHMRKSGILYGAFGVLIPVVIWILTQFQSGDSFANILSFYVNPYHIQNISAVVLSNIKYFFTDVGPMYLLVIMIAWVVSIVRRYKLHIIVGPEEIIAFVFCILCILAYLRTSGMFRYLYPAQVISLIFFPFILRNISFNKLFLRATNIILIFLVCMGCYQICFNSWVAESYTSHKTSDWQRYFAEMPASESVFFYNTPEVAIFMKGNNYYQYLEPAANMKIGEKGLDDVRSGLPDEVIIDTNAISEANKEIFAKYYPFMEFYKYTILKKNSQ